MRRNAPRVLQRFIRRLQSRLSTPDRTTDGGYRTVRLPPDMAKAAASLVDRDSLTKPRILNMITEGHQYERTHPQIIDWAKAFQKEMTARGIPFYPFEFYRSPERQENLRKMGRSKAGPWRSPHQFGCGVDFVSCTKLWDLTERQWQIIGAIGKEIARKRGVKLDWGGDWRFYDPAHWQMRNFRDYRWAHFEAQRQGYNPATMSDVVYFSLLDKIIIEQKQKDKKLRTPVLAAS